MKPQQVSIDFDAATMRAEKGIKDSADHADAVEAGWTYQALAYLRQFISTPREPFLIEDLRAWAESNGLPAPANNKAWGKVTRMAVSRKLIEKAGAAAAVSSNHSLKHLWRRVRP
jgi:hypothetical protein